jgi:hypothetical protein
MSKKIIAIFTVLLLSGCTNEISEIGKDTYALSFNRYTYRGAKFDEVDMSMMKVDVQAILVDYCKTKFDKYPIVLQDEMKLLNEDTTFAGIVKFRCDGE